MTIDPPAADPPEGGETTASIVILRDLPAVH